MSGPLTNAAVRVLQAAQQPIDRRLGGIDARERGVDAFTVAGSERSDECRVVLGRQRGTRRRGRLVSAGPEEGEREQRD